MLGIQEQVFLGHSTTKTGQWKS